MYAPVSIRCTFVRSSHSMPNRDAHDVEAVASAREVPLVSLQLPWVMPMPCQIRLPRSAYQANAPPRTRGRAGAGRPGPFASPVLVPQPGGGAGSDPSDEAPLAAVGLLLRELVPSLSLARFHTVGLSPSNPSCLSPLRVSFGLPPARPPTAAPAGSGMEADGIEARAAWAAVDNSPRIATRPSGLSGGSGPEVDPLNPMTSTFEARGVGPKSPRAVRNSAPPLSLYAAVPLSRAAWRARRLLARLRRRRSLWDAAARSCPRGVAPCQARGLRRPPTHRDPHLLSGRFAVVAEVVSAERQAAETRAPLPRACRVHGRHAERPTTSGLVAALSKS